MNTQSLDLLIGNILGTQAKTKVEPKKKAVVPVISKPNTPPVIDIIIQPKPEVINKIEIVEYSEKSFALFGETKPIKDQLSKLEGKFNPFLTHPKTGLKTAGWIFSKRHEDKVRQDLNL